MPSPGTKCRTVGRATPGLAGSTVAELLLRRFGVCQDLSHLVVSCLRSAGLAARRRRITCWASVLGPQAGWVDVDPTNDQFVDDRYLVLTHGRDYDDVPPLKGVILSDASHSTMGVRVDV